MANVENKPGILERTSYVLRNAEATAAVVLGVLGHFGAAGVLALGAIVDHATAKFFEKRRLRRAAA